MSEVTNEATNETNQATTEENVVIAKWACVLAYLIFFLPLVVEGDKTVHRFHANQGLVLLILSVAVTTIGTIIPIIGWLIILPFGGIFCFVLAIMGMVNTGNGKMKELPLIGKIKILK